MRSSGWGMAGSGRRVIVLSLALLVMAVGIWISVPAHSQEERAADESTSQTRFQAREGNSAEADKDSEELKPIPEIRGSKATQRQFFKAPGPLAGTETTSFDTNRDGFTDLIVIPGDCKAREGASLVLEDDDGTQGTLIDNENIQIEAKRRALR